MLICICQIVPESAVRQAISQGARTRREIGQRCDAGTVCGACHPLLDRLLAESGVPAARPDPAKDAAGPAAPGKALGEKPGP